MTCDYLTWQNNVTVTNGWFCTSPLCISMFCLL